MPVRNDPTTKTTPKTPTPTTTPKTPTAAEAQAAAKAAKAKAEEGAEDLGAAQTATTTAEKHLPLNELNAVRGDIRRAFLTGESDVVLQKLAKLPPADARAVLDEIAADPDKLATMMKGDNKTAFLQLMTSKGYVGVEPAKVPPPPSSPRAPQPPPAPALYRDDAQLPAPLREALLNENIATAKQYKESFDDYRDAYKSAVTESKSMGELRALGKMAEPASPEHLPGAKPSDPNNIKYEHARGPNVPDTEVTALVSNKAARLAGREVPGLSLIAEGKAVLKIGDGHGPQVIRGVEGKVTRGPDGEVHGHGAHVTGFGAAGGFVETTGHDVTAGYENHKTHMGGSVKVSEEGVEARAKLGAAVIKAGYNGNGGSIGGGVNGEATLIEGVAAIEVEGTASVGFQGVSREDAEQFASSSQVGFFDTPPELGRKSWSALPEASRHDYELQGWSEKEWSTASDLERAKRR